VETIGEWKPIKFQIQGVSLQTWINDNPTADLKEAVFPEVYLPFKQWELGRFVFRNVNSKSLSAKNLK